MSEGKLRKRAALRVGSLISQLLQANWAGEYIRRIAILTALTAFIIRIQPGCGELRLYAHSHPCTHCFEQFLTSKCPYSLSISRL